MKQIINKFYRKRKLLAELKEISIRGRFIFGFLLLKMEIRNLNIQDNLLEEVLLKLKEFTVTPSLIKWGNVLNDYDPFSILEQHPNNNFEEYDYISVEKAESLKKLYDKLPIKITEGISLVIEIGSSNLEGGTGKYSKYSLSPLLKLIELFEYKEEYTITKALKELTPFSDNNGWGNSMPFPDGLSLPTLSED